MIFNGGWHGVCPPSKERGFKMHIHLLANGSSVITTSTHKFKFSDGTESEPQDREVCERLTLRRELRLIETIQGMALNQVSMVLSSEQLAYLGYLSREATLVLVPFPVLTALREMGVRETFPNVVAFNATPETQRSAPNDKVVLS